MKRIYILFVSALVILLLLAGCAAGKGLARDNASGEAAAPGAPTASATRPPSGVDTGLTGGGDYGSPDKAQVEELYGGRKVIRNYNLTIQTDDFDGVLSAIEQRLASSGGYSQSSTIDGKKPSSYGDGGRSARLTLRVPAENAQSFIKDVQGMGTLLNSYDNADDITDAYFDIDSRLGVLKIELERLQSILVQTDNLADIILLESRISDVMYEIERLTGTLKKYDALVSYSTVEITLYEESLREGPAATKTSGQRIREGFTNSLYGVGTFFTNLFVWFVSALPVLAVLAVFVLIIVFIVRTCTKRSARKQAERAAKAAVLQQALFEKQKEAYAKQQNAEAAEGNEHESK